MRPDRERRRAERLLATDYGWPARAPRRSRAGWLWLGVRFAAGFLVGLALFLLVTELW